MLVDIFTMQLCELLDKPDHARVHCSRTYFEAWRDRRL